MNTHIQLSTILTPADLAEAVQALRQRAEEWEQKAQVLEKSDVRYRGYLLNRPPDCPKLSLAEFRERTNELEGFYQDQKEYIELWPHVPWCDAPYARDIARLEGILGI